MISRILVLIAKEKSTPRSKIKGRALILGGFFLNVFFLFIRLNSALITLEDAKFLYNVRSFIEMRGETSPFSFRASISLPGEISTLFIPRLNQFCTTYKSPKESLKKPHRTGQQLNLWLWLLFVRKFFFTLWEDKW